MKFLYATLLVLIASALIACSHYTKATAKPTPDESYQSSMKRLDKEIKALIGSASCSSDSQCHSIGFGHKPCGGFYAYRIYSDKNTNVNLLKSKVSRYNALSREWNRKNQLASNCMMLMQPQLACRNQTCQIK